MKYILIILFFDISINYLAQDQSSINYFSFLPSGSIIVEKIFGDLNKDGIDDCVLLIKATDSNNVITDEYSGKLDRNRRGIIILFRENDKYVLASKNFTCFSSENEDGGVYFPPELTIEIKKGNLYFEYNHGRYGYWKYTFRFEVSDFEMIGFDQSENYGPIINSQTSINFLSKKKQLKVNTTSNAEEGGDEVFTETWSNVIVEKRIKLSDIVDFDEIDMSEF